MITIVYSTHKDEVYNKNFREHLENTIGVDDYQILEYQNNNEYSLSEIYNRGIKESKFDIVCCIHNDIKLEKKWGSRLLKDFEKNPEYAIIGKAGSTYFPQSGVYWEKMNQTMVGEVYHHPDGQNKWINKYSAKLPFIIPVVTIDGLFISFDKTKIKHQFDESFGRFHFYDHGFCVPNFLDGVKIGVTFSFEITHKSVGQPNEEFFKTKDQFLTKYISKLPLELKPPSVYVPTIEKKHFRNFGKVAVIIPTKGKTDLLFNCLNSFIKHCDKELYEVFVADTGSTEKEIELIKNFIEENKDKIKINLFFYNFYTFAIVNNHVVKNHVSDEFKFILFCNNDIVLLNDVLSGMLEVYRKTPNTGTVGCRLHFGDNTIQHDGIVGYRHKENNALIFTHLGLRSHYVYTPFLKKVCGNTGALMMIRKNLFEKCGYFNENYGTCFEDVELNFTCLLNGYENYYDGTLVAYHYESSTRGKTQENENGERIDYTKYLLPFVEKNIEKLRKYFMVV